MAPEAWLIVALIVAMAVALWSVFHLRAQHRKTRAQIAEMDRLNIALEQFASRAAHDLRNPLATIRMALDMLSREPTNETQRIAVEIMDRQTDRALELIDGLLALARATGTPRPAVCDLRPLVEQVALTADVEVTVEQDGPVIADPVGLQQIVSNLVENAARYARADGRAHLTVRRDEAPSGWVLSFADRGPGVDEADLRKIFRPFERGQHAPGSGTGLGLAIVEAIAAAHGGRCWYEAREGGGSVFNVFLPRAADLPPPAAAEGHA